MPVLVGPSVSRVVEDRVHGATEREHSSPGRPGETEQQEKLNNTEHQQGITPIFRHCDKTKIAASIEKHCKGQQKTFAKTSIADIRC